MATDVSICSAALLLLGDKPIASLGEAGQKAQLCANLYPIAKRATLRCHPWNCLIKRVVLTPLASAPAFDWRYQFALPGDVLRILQVGHTGSTLPYETEGGRILCNTDQLPLRYVADVTEGNWDDLLVDVMVKRMECDLAYPITKSTSLRDSLLTEFMRPAVGVLAKAKNVDAQENPPEDWGDSPFLSVRGGTTR
jgi:hypothetical protein